MAQYDSVNNAIREGFLKPPIQQIYNEEVNIATTDTAAEIAATKFDTLQIPSFESLLEDKSSSPFTRLEFLDFLKRMHCSENLEFVLVARCYISSDEDILLKQHIWGSIHNNFISKQSPKELNLPYDLMHSLEEHSKNGTLPSNEIINKTINSLLFLLRDGFQQYIHYLKKLSDNSNDVNNNIDCINENYCLSVKNARRQSEHFSPLDSPTNLNSIRCISPLSNTAVNFNHSHYYNDEDVYTKTKVISKVSIDEVNEEDEHHKDALTSKGHNNINIRHNSISADKKERLPSLGSKNSFSEAGSNFKKIAEKLKWRRLSSNSSI